MTTDKRNRKIRVITLLLLLSILYTVMMSVCSPLVRDIPDGDYPIFYLIGKMWSEGHVPYVEMFDHKGPFIFFVYMIGIMIHSVYGVYILQTIALWIVLCIAFRMEAGEEWNVSVYSILCVSAVLAFFPFAEFQYPLTEEFCLPFLILSAFGVYHYLDRMEENKEHSAGWAVVYGITFGVCLFTRVTNACALAVWVLTITIVLLIHQKWKNLLFNILGFLAGTAMIILPFILYFALQGALYDLFYGTILFNVGNTVGISSAVGITTSIRHILRTSPAWGCILLCVIARSVDRKIRLVHILAAIASIMVVSLGYAFGHYSIILAVFVPVDVQLLRFFCQDRKVEIKHVWKGLIVLSSLFALAVCGVRGYSKITNFMQGSQESAYETASKTIASYIPEEDRDAVIGYDVSSQFYLYTDIMPCYKYFTFQYKQSRYSEQMLRENIEFYQSAAAKWIVVEGWITFPEIQSAIEENYSLYESYQLAEDGTALYLYERKKDI